MQVQAATAGPEMGERIQEAEKAVAALQAELHTSRAEALHWQGLLAKASAEGEEQAQHAQGLEVHGHELQVTAKRLTVSPQTTIGIAFPCH